jgi:hypothetical protein
MSKQAKNVTVQVKNDEHQQASWSILWEKGSVHHQVPCTSMSRGKYLNLMRKNYPHYTVTNEIEQPILMTPSEQVFEPSTTQVIDPSVFGPMPEPDFEGERDYDSLAKAISNDDELTAVQLNLINDTPALKEAYHAFQQGKILIAPTLIDKDEESIAIVGSDIVEKSTSEVIEIIAKPIVKQVETMNTNKEAAAAAPEAQPKTNEVQPTKVGFGKKLQWYSAAAGTGAAIGLFTLPELFFKGIEVGGRFGYNSFRNTEAAVVDVLNVVEADRQGIKDSIDRRMDSVGNVVAWPVVAPVKLASRLITETKKEIVAETIITAPTVATA